MERLLFRLRVVRPLFNTFEEVTKAHRDTHGLRTADSGCVHSMRGAETAREVIHHRIMDRIALAEDRILIQQSLLHLVKQGLNSDGTLRINVRNRRPQILGENYKAESDAM